MHSMVDVEYKEFELAPMSYSRGVHLNNDYSIATMYVSNMLSR